MNLMFPLTCERFGAEGSLPNNSLKVSASISMETETRLTMLVSGGFFMFSFLAINTDKVCSKPGDPLEKTTQKHSLMLN